VLVLLPEDFEGSLIHPVESPPYYEKSTINFDFLAILSPACGQGTITFQYFDALNPIRIYTDLADSRYSVGLFKAGADFSSPPLATTTIYENTGLFQYNGPDIVIPGTSPGNPVNLEVRVWLTAFGWDASPIQASGSFTSQPLGGRHPNPPPPALPSPDLTGFQGITYVPEPSTYALAVAGLGTLVVLRSKRR
jgi:hypothetical protein